MNLPGWVCLGLVVMICLFATMGCAPTVPDSFTGICAVQPTHQVQGGFVAKVYCERSE